MVDRKSSNAPTKGEPMKAILMRLTPVTAAIMMLMFSAIAFAAPAVPVEIVAQQVWWQTLLSELLKVFVLIAVPVLTALIVILLKRGGMKIDSEQIEKLAGAAAGWAEQKALEALKDGKPKTSGADKMKLAIDFANGAVGQYGLKKKAIGKLQELIESHLGKEQIKVAAQPKLVSAIATLDTTEG